MTKKELLALYKAKSAELKALTDKGDDMTPEDVTAGETLADEVDALKAQIAEFGKADALKARIAANDTFASTAVAPGRIGHAAARTEHVDAEESETDKLLLTGGFKCLGHYALSVAKEKAGYAADLKARFHGAIKSYNHGVLNESGGDMKAANGMLEASDSEGGEFVPLTFAQGIWSRSLGQQQNLWARVGAIPIAGNTMRVSAYADDDRRDGQRMGGVAGVWMGEAGTFQKSKPSTRHIDLRLNKLGVFVWATEELLEDSATALDSELNRLAPDEFTFKLNDALVRGTGGGQPEGFLNSPAKITVAGTGSQGSKIVAQNIDDMWARRVTGSEANLIWLYNQDIEGQLNATYYSTGNNSGQLAYFPVGGISAQPTPILKGRPMIAIEQAESVGTEGDISLVDFSQFVAIQKSTGIHQAVSMHLAFDTAQVAFRFSIRVDAKPRWETALTRYKGAAKLSPFVTLSSTRT
jgi:HK97 family phage major capsid protein